MKLKLLLVTLFLLTLSACSPNIAYTPQTTMSKEQAKEIIIRALREQPDTDEIPTDINITDDYLELSYGDERVFIYYDNIGDIHFYKKAYYHVQVNDKDSHSKIDLEIANEQKAKAFIDALNSLMIGVK